MDVKQTNGHGNSTVQNGHGDRTVQNGHGDRTVQNGHGDSVVKNGCNRHCSNKRHDEHHYLDAIQEVLDHGVKKSNRTGTDTLSIFGMQMRYSLRDRMCIMER